VILFAPAKKFFRSQQKQRENAKKMAKIEMAKRKVFPSISIRRKLMEPSLSTPFN